MRSDFLFYLDSASDHVDAVQDIGLQSEFYLNGYSLTLPIKQNIAILINNLYCNLLPFTGSRFYYRSNI